MSAALFDLASHGRHRGVSAGTAPAEQVHPVVVEAMAELGIDLGRVVPRSLTDELARGADVIVTMGCGDACPVVVGKRYVEWELPDPKDMPLAQVRELRDEIARRVAALADELTPARRED